MMGKGALELYSTQEELELILDRIWSTKVDQHDYGDGKTDFTEFLVAMNRIIEEHNDPNNHEVHLPDVPLDKLQTKQMKVGFGGTTWRKAEDATALTSYDTYSATYAHTTNATSCPHHHRPTQPRCPSTTGSRRRWNSR